MNGTIISVGGSPSEGANVVVRIDDELELVFTMTLAAARRYRVGDQVDVQIRKAKS